MFFSCSALSFEKSANMAAKIWVKNEETCKFNPWNFHPENHKTDIGYGWNQPKSGSLVWGKFNKAFLHFLPNFWHIWWFFKVLKSFFGALHFEKSSKLATIWPKMKKSLVPTCLKPISPWHFQTWVLGTRSVTTTNPDTSLKICNSEHLSSLIWWASADFTHKDFYFWSQMITFGPILRSLLPLGIHIDVRHKRIELLNYFSGFSTKLDTKARRRFLKWDFATRHTRTNTNTVFVYKYVCSVFFTDR